MNTFATAHDATRQDIPYVQCEAACFARELSLTSLPDDLEFCREKLHVATKPRRFTCISPLVVILLLLLGPAPLQSAEQNVLTPAQIAEGWISLFDGETLFGWTPTSQANWKVADGAITVSEGEQGFLMTNSELADYELHVEFKAPAQTNSGVFLRTPVAPTDPATDCIELNIAPADNPFPTMSLVGRLRTELSNSLVRRDDGQGYRPADRNDIPDPWDGQWHALDVMLNGSACEVGLDGVIPYAYFAEESNYGSLDDQAPRVGRIGLQFRQGPVAFRNIRLKPLGLKPMLNGRDLSGWNTKNAEASKFEVVPSPDNTSGSLPSPDSSDSLHPSDPSGPLPLEGRAGEGVEAGTRAAHPSLTLPIEGRGPDEDESAPAELHVTNGRGILETDAQYGDFIMQLDCYVDGDGLNSGVFFRSIPGEYANGYESQIQNAVKEGDPTQPVDAGTGAIYRRTTARRVVSRDREWFTKTIVATGPHIAVWVNGRQVTDWTDDRPPHENPRTGRRTAPGTISLQGHDPTTNLRFRNLRIAELPADRDAPAAPPVSRDATAEREEAKQ